MIQNWISGIYSRSETLIEATRRQDKTLQQLYENKKRKLIKRQIKNKFDYISDPLIDWDDHIRPFTDNLRGVEKGALTRYYENNTFYRQPIITNKITTSGQILKNNICFNLFPKRTKIKIDVLDPFTLYDLSVNEFYKSEEELIGDFGNIIRKELLRIKDNVNLIQFNAPSLARVQEKEQLNMVKEVMNKVTKNLNVTTCLNLWGSDISNTINEFVNFPVDVIGIDFVTTKINKCDPIPINKMLACGLIDAKNTKMEEKKQIIKKLKIIRKQFGVKSISLIPSWDFEFIPETFANRKIELMKLIKQDKKDR